MDDRARRWIRRLQLQQHPEGGWYRESYRAGDCFPMEGLPSRYDGDRAYSTAIYYLLAEGDFSHLHRLRSDEVWHHYDGGSVLLHMFGVEEGYRKVRLGSDACSQPQVVVPGGVWMGATCEAPRAYALVGCTMAPGFEFADFELAVRETMVERFPEQTEIIESLTGSPDVA